MVSLSIRMLGSSFTSSVDAIKSTASQKKQNTASTQAPQAEQGALGSVQEEFLAYAKMNPVERIRAEYLKSHDLSEEKLASMSPEERQKIEDEIRREIERKIKRMVEQKGSIVNLVV